MWGPSQGESGLIRPGGSLDADAGAIPVLLLTEVTGEHMMGLQGEGGVRNELHRELHGAAWKGWRRKGSS